MVKFMVKVRVKANPATIMLEGFLAIKKDQQLTIIDLQLIISFIHSTIKCHYTMPMKLCLNPLCQRQGYHALTDLLKTLNSLEQAKLKYKYHALKLVGVLLPPLYFQARLTL